ncbi:MAG: sodium-dependent bicarbonate transport family permease [Candidatus Carbobacillus altaicus]|nr:sodium-dependent bicarbonate transport family permease [Candidatus Carbobacillus altaicus]
MGEIILANLLTPAVLFFVLGFLAAVLKSDLSLPKGLGESLSIYLLIAIGLKGGIEMSQHEWQEIIRPVLGTLFLGLLIPIVALFIARLLSLDLPNAVAIGATYGSVSIVTFGATLAFLDHVGEPYESYVSALVVLLESPAILVSLLMYAILKTHKVSLQYRVATVGARSRAADAIATVKKKEGAQPKSGIFSSIVREALLGPSVLLLVGSLLIGLIIGQRALPVVKPLFIDMYSSVLILFLLYMGFSAGSRVATLSRYGLRTLLLGFGFPLLFGAFGVWVGSLSGLTTGGMTVMGVLAGSASYIAAPAAIQKAVPEANPSLYLGLALGLTFPFNLTIGMPLFYQLAQWIHG